MWRQFISFLLIVNTAQSIKFDPTTGRFKNIIVQLSDHLNPSECDTILANIKVIAIFVILKMINLIINVLPVKN